MIVSNAGANDLTGAHVLAVCLPFVLLSMAAVLRHGRGAGQKGAEERCHGDLKYSFGEESVAGFKEAFEKGGGKIAKEMTQPFPERGISAVPDRNRIAQA